MAILIFSIVFGSGIIAGYWKHFKMWRLGRAIDSIRFEETCLKNSLDELAKEVSIVNTCKGGLLGIKRTLEKARLDNSILKLRLESANQSCRFIEGRLKSKLRLSKRQYWEDRKIEFLSLRKELKSAIKQADIAIETAELVFFHDKKQGA